MLDVGPDDALGVDRFDFGLSIGTGQDRADVSGAIFSPVDASRVYLAQANPDAVAILERSEVPASTVQADGTITYAPRLQTQVGPTAPMNDARPSQVVYVQRGNANSDLLAVSSLARDAIFFFEPSEGALKLAGRFALARGQGPFDLMHVAADGKDYLFVTTFFDHGLTVLDISSAAYGDFRLAASLHDALFPVASSLP
ncbi:MAG: hypothetical protein EOO40_12665 [Deltaproteobacteria bacterium]|nr:MAG: hypothetical protein EOO40_12665 [Deltaproteobacteria bacterium]